MANGIANMIANMPQFQPVSAYAQGQQIGQQNKLAQLQMQQAKQQMTQQQRQQDIQTLGGLLQGVRDEQGYQQALNMAQNMGVGEQTLGGLRKTMPQFDPQMNQRLLNAYGFGPEPMEQTSLTRNAIAAGYKPGTPEFRDFIQENIGRPSTQVTIGDKVRSAKEEVKVGDIKARADRARSRISDVYGAAEASYKQLPEVNRALQLLDKVETGPFQETKMEAVKAMNSLFGTEIDAEAVSSAEELRTLLGNQVMARVQQTKGAVSEKEMDMFASYSANFGNTVEGNKNILEFQKKQLKRARDIANKVSDWESKGLSSLEIERKTREYMNDHPITDVLEPPEEQEKAQEEELSIDDLVNMYR